MTARWEDVARLTCPVQLMMRPGQHRGDCLGCEQIATALEAAYRAGREDAAKVADGAAVRHQGNHYAHSVAVVIARAIREEV